MRPRSYATSSTSSARTQAKRRLNSFKVPRACPWESTEESLNPGGVFRSNLQRYGLSSCVTFYEEPFQGVFNANKLTVPIGMYFYDGAHDFESQYQGIKLAEPFLADTALVIIDDWRFAKDSQSYAKVGTERAIAESVNAWQLLYELPARFNGDRALWWNGVAVFAFRRQSRN